MKTHEFSIIASGSTLDGDDFDARLYDNGGDDAIVSFQKGHLIIDFAREADTLQSAIASAMQDVARSGGNVERVEPDPLVSLAEIAARTNTVVRRSANIGMDSGGVRISPPPSLKSRPTALSGVGRPLQNG